ncbi:hypothetical protein AX16_006607 [Volvariella volvacea WC 439]|nr:hypothetical protein AX16_006607 [Volvariella volvacea WC 439]
MSGISNVWVVSPDTRSERRLDPHLTVSQLKTKLEPITGIPTGNQVISLFNAENDAQPITRLDDDTKQLGFYGLRDWQMLKVEDANPSTTLTGRFGDYSQVEKFEISEEAYAKRQDSVLAYKQQHKVGRFAPKDQHEKDEKEYDIPIGARCEVESSEPGLSKRGTVRYYGSTKFASGKWVGVEYDEPFGKNDGSVNGEQYFSCRQNYGVFVRPDKVKVGDFPPEELSLDEEEI